MKQRLEVQKASWVNEQELELHIDESHSLTTLKAAGQILADSEGLSFVYLLEEQNTYHYMFISDPFWEDLKESMNRNVSIFVTNGNERLLLTRFQEELTDLIDNIKGNSNYGDKMVSKVETAF
jgi:hypothetical protein